MKDNIEWQYMGDVFDTPVGFGFVYMIKFEDGEKYIGKKNFYSKRKRNFGKKELALITDKRKKKYEIVTKESDWKSYVSSNSVVHQKIKDGIPYYKEILFLGSCSKHLSFLEEYYLFTYSVLWNEDYINDNIGGRYFSKDIHEWEWIRN